ncbi:MAG: WXG100 family type VII secretion target [Lachnospiraceae bacterium]
MAGEVRLSYGEMEDNCSRLKDYAGQLMSISESVTSVVGSFSGVWTGQAETAFEEDYTTLMTSMKSAIDVMEEITTMVQGYVNDMQEIEAAYGSSSHVTIG